MVKAKQSEEVKKEQRVIHPKELSGHNIDNIVNPVDRHVTKKRSTIINRVVNSVSLLIQPNVRLV